MHIGRLQGSRVLLDVKGRKEPTAEDYWEANWLVVGMTVEMGHWRGRFDVDLRAEEFERFLLELRHLYEQLDSVAEFATMERWLSLRLEGDGLGHIKVAGEARDRPGSEDRLLFTTGLDQTDLAELIHELQAVVAEFPVRGESSAE